MWGAQFDCMETEWGKLNTAPPPDNVNMDQARVNAAIPGAAAFKTGVKESPSLELTRPNSLKNFVVDQQCLGGHSLEGEKNLNQARFLMPRLNLVPEGHLFQVPRAGLCMACSPTFRQHGVARPARGVWGK